VTLFPDPDKPLTMMSFMIAVKRPAITPASNA